MITISPKKMTVEEKILGMEAIWQDLCQHSHFESPDWHKFVLSKRQAQRAAGKQKPMAWSDAKQQMLNAIK